MKNLTPVVRLIDSAMCLISARGYTRTLLNRSPDWKKVQSETETFHENLLYLSKAEGKSADFINDFLRKKKTVGILRHIFDGGYPTSAVGDLYHWVRLNWPSISDRGGLYDSESRFISDVVSLVGYLDRPNESVTDNVRSTISVTFNNMIRSMEEYEEDLSLLTEQMTDEEINYRGIRILNPWRLKYEYLSDVFDSVDFLLALFKRRNVLDVLSKTLRSIVVVPQRELVKSGISSRNAHGMYFHDERTVVLAIDVMRGGNPRMLKNWVHEVLVHEIGHLVHMSFLSPEAAKFWDSGWEDVRNTERNIGKITYKERVKFWNLLLGVKGDLRKIKLKGLDRLKFHEWLANPMTNEPYVTKKNLRWSARGKRTVAQYMKDPGQYEEDNGPRSVKVIRSNLGITDYYRDTDFPISVVLLDSNPSYKSAVLNEIKKLGAPTWYAETDEKEDFAETFVQFMDNPKKLSDNALYRMRRTLYLSGLYGKRVMKRVDAKFEEDSV